MHVVIAHIGANTPKNYGRESAEELAEQRDRMDAIERRWNDLGDMLGLERPKVLLSPDEKRAKLDAIALELGLMPRGNVERGSAQEPSA